MTLGATYNEVTVSPMNTGENELQTAEIRRIQWVKHAGRRCGSILTARSSWNFMAQLSRLMRDWSRKRELDEALGLTATAGDMFRDPRHGKNTQHELGGLPRQSLYSRLAGYEDTNDAERLKVVRYSRYVFLQMAEVAVDRSG